MDNPKQNPQTPKPGLKMSALVEMTRVPKSTILHYLSKDLLPEPVRTSLNMAYYHPDCVDRIRFIQHMQQNHRLTLREIKQLIDSTGEDATNLTARLELNDMVFGKNAGSSETMDETAFLQATGLQQSALEALLGHQLLIPKAENRFDDEDVVLGRVYAQAMSWGISAENLAFYADLGRQIVDHELGLRAHMTHDLDYEEDIGITIQMLKNARLCRSYVLERLFQKKVGGMKDIKAR